MTTRTITLTGRRPVTIDEDAWPRIAEALEHHSCGEHAQNGKVSWQLRIRQHADGRLIMYGTTRGWCQCSDTETTTPRAGYVLPAGTSDAELAAMALQVAKAILPPDYGSAEGLAQDLMADLPAAVE